MNPILKYLLWSLGFYIAYCGLLFILQRQIMFPRGMIPQPAQTIPKDDNLERIWLQTEAGNVESWLLLPAAGSMTGASPAVIFGHGNGELID